MESQPTQIVQSQYTYDAYQNLTGIKVQQGSQQVLNQVNKYNYINQLTGVYESNGTTPVVTYTYDNAGNLIKETRNNAVESTYEYNESNLLTSKTNKKGSSVLSSYTYEYYLDGNQAKVTENTGRVQSFVYDGAGRLEQETDTSGTNKVYGYDAFGNQTGGENADVYNPFRYNGQYTDEETGLIYLRNRYYDPATGRFMTEDPVKDGLNWYVYCSNNPVLLADPWGLEPNWRDDQTEYREGRFVSKPAAAEIDRLLAEFQELTIEYSAPGMTFDDTYKQKADAISAKLDQVIADDRNAVVYDVPLYSQGTTLLCYAYVQVMYECYSSGVTLTQEEADQRAQEIAEEYNRTHMIPPGAEQGGWPSGIRIKQNDAEALMQIGEYLKEGTLISLAYRPVKKGGHVNLVIGYMEIGGESYFMVNDPAFESFSRRWLSTSEIRTLPDGQSFQEYVRMGN